MADAILISLKREAEKGSKTLRLQKVADALVDIAMAGDVAAIKEICDRVDGRVPQALPIDPNTGRPGRIVIGWINDDGDGQMLAIEPPKEE